MKAALQATNIIISAALKFLTTCSEDELYDIAAKRTTVSIALTCCSKDKPKKSRKDTIHFHNILAMLENAPDREAGLNALLANISGKEGLLRLAKQLDIPVNQKMSIEKISNSIVESTTGSRIRSKAIQG